jgi:nitrate/nitrite transport system ATP-binding protein
MRQRVAVARALAMQPQVLLMDEPLSALDALTRANLQDEIEAIWRKQGVTVILVTNDVDEALLLADRIIPLTPAPRATFGREFKVKLARPRDRTAVNHDEEYRHLRAEITAYLQAMSQEASFGSDDKRLPPQVTPITAADRTPKSVRTEPDKPAANVDKYAEFYDVTKIYPTQNGPLTVVDKFNLNIRKGEFISLIGHSGCGKSTVLSMMAGLNEISDGGIGSRRGVPSAESLAVADRSAERGLGRQSRVFPRQRERTRGYRRLLLDACRVGGCTRQEGQRAIKRHEAACGVGARVRAVAEAPLARRTVRDA